MNSFCTRWMPNKNEKFQYILILTLKETYLMPKKVLIISSCFYPENVPGSHRMAAFARHLSEFGWQATVICPDCTPANMPRHYDESLTTFGHCPVIRVESPPPKSELLERIFNKLFVIAGLKDLLGFTPHRVYRRLLNTALELAAKEHFDAVLATAPRAYTMRIANQLNTEFGIPWAADFRDVPGELTRHQGHWSTEKMALNLIMKFCASAQALVTVSTPLAKKLESASDKPVEVIFNGFESQKQTTKNKNPDIFTIVYCGSIMIDRDPTPLLDALDLMIKNKNPLVHKLRFHYYGRSGQLLKKYIGERPCSHLVQDMGSVSLQESLNAQQNATALLLLSHANGIGIMTSKIFEYLAARRPILSVPGDQDVTDELLDKTRAGITGSNPEQLVNILSSWLNEWIENKALNYKVDETEVAKYSRIRQTERLANLLGRISNK
ncbi:MAG: hypothetical protein MI864_20395, partial [Pseudomonadales bacterium]|nr:hypothetical protein [Pseudomonadales bacterium]